MDTITSDSIQRILGNNTIRVSFTATTIRVYQAYNAAIASSAVEHQSFSNAPGFKSTRMTWIKPSFCWMAYRSGFGFKDANQERVLAIDLDRRAFDRIVGGAVLSKDGSGACGGSDVVVQWDPERDVELKKVEDIRAIQIGLRGETAKEYADGVFIACITDVTHIFHAVHELVLSGHIQEAQALLPTESVYHISSYLIE
ncbi:hypothetical protein BCR33DRAFT_356461 [Rhizoclosmatium globosum]|uniref:Uncharacterized protein n=1 Tax=Rhizoclosmatium globosum TaxID=329046 RepID=A0A1Y2C2Y4_9FUNG|nr:hypothetical protein BCR33DRAFT_356461 [Rhizoclosmatium globosum]|eukprot:ORY40675.1 hypothetical protein BCR33DRAFT_356461 [Rhizoclosmatium globosum]